MAKLTIKAGSTSQTVNIFIADSSSTTGAGLTGLVYNTSSLVAYYALPKAAAVSITLATLAAVTSAFSSGGFKEVDATNMPGWYRFDIPDAAIASGRFVAIHFKGATNMAPLPLEIELTAVDNQSATAFMTGVNSIAPPSNWNLMSIDASGRVDVIKLAGTTCTARDIGASVLLSSGTGTGQLDFTSGVVKGNITQLLGTAWLTPGTAGTPDVNVKLWNALATVELPLVPTTAGRKLDVSAGGEAGFDWSNIGSPTTTVDLSGTTIKTTQKVDVDTIKTNPVVNGGTVTFPTNSTLASTTNIVAGTVAVATALGAAYDAAKTASQAGDAMALTTLHSPNLQAGTAQAGANGSITLAAGASATDSLYKGLVVRVYGGTGAGQSRVITAYNGTTKVATVDWNWTTNPDNTSTYALLSLESAKLDSSQQVVAASVTGNVGGNVTGSVGSLAVQAKADVNAEVVDCLAVDTYAEPTGAPAATATLATKIGRMHQALRNKVTVTATTKTFVDDSNNALWAKALSDDGTTFIEAEGA